MKGMRYYPSTYNPHPSPLTPIRREWSPSHHLVTSVTREAAPVVAPSPVAAPDAMMSLAAIEHLDFAIGEEARTADCSVCGFGVTVNPGVSHGGDTFGGIPTSTLLASFVVQHARHREIRGRQVASGLTPDGRVTAAAKAVLA